MGKVFGLIDNDAVYKLACCNLLTESFQYLKLEGQYALQPVPHVIEQDIFGAGQFGHNKPVVRERVIKAAYTIPKIKEGNVDDVALLSELLDAFDYGEAFLLYQAIKYDSMLLVSGDKRFYKALGNKPRIMKACSHLEGKLICLEHLILCLIEEQGFDFIRQRIAPVRKCDGSLSLAFRQGSKTLESSAIDGLVSFSRSTITSLGKLAYMHQPWYR